jgi:hypothetical protein
MSKTTPLYERLFHELTEAERKTLTDIKVPDDIKTTECVAEWTDDHIDCFGAKINGVELGFWCVGPQFGGYLECADESAKARKRVFDTLVREIQSSEDDAQDRE